MVRVAKTLRNKSSSRRRIPRITGNRICIRNGITPRETRINRTKLWLLRLLISIARVWFILINLVLWNGTELILSLVWLICELQLTCDNRTCTSLSRRYLDRSMNCRSWLGYRDLRNFHGCRDRRNWSYRYSRNRCCRLNRRCSSCNSLRRSLRCIRPKLLNRTRCRSLNSRMERLLGWPRNQRLSRVKR